MTIYQPLPPIVIDVEPGTPLSIEIDDADWPLWQANGWLNIDPNTPDLTERMTIYQPLPPIVLDVAPGTPNSLEIDAVDWPLWQANGWLNVDPNNTVIVGPSIFDLNELSTDADLTAWEGKMPGLAQRAAAYLGKRTLAKNFIKKTLLKRGVDPDAIGVPSELKDAATFKELELIFRDMSDKSESIAGEKARHYASLFDSEMELIILSLMTGSGWTEGRPTVSSIPLLRS